MKKLEKYKWICPQPFTNIHVHIRGEMKPCCTMDYSPEMQKFPDIEIHNIEESSFKEYYHSETMKRLRNAMRNENDDEYVYAMCGKCSRVEESGNRSQRQYYVNRFNNEFKDKKEELERIIAEDAEPTFLHSFEFKPLVSNKCNLACNMCGSEWSTRYFAESIKLGEVEKQKTILSPDISPKAWEEMPEILSKLEEIKLAGGEPLMSEDTYRMLEMIPNPENKRLKIITNGTINPERFIEHAKKFKSVDVNISVEGIPSITEYIRYPSKWNEVEENYHKFNEIARTRFVSTVNALNVGTSPEFHEFMEDKGYLFSQNNPVVNNPYKLASIPPELRDIYLNKLYSAKLKNIIRFLEYAEYDESEMFKMLSHIKRRDRLRKRCLIDVMPEWKPYYDKVIV